MKEDILNELNERTNDLLKTIMLFSEKEFNTVPFEGSWTAAQVAQHLLKSESGIVKTLNGNTVLTQRKPDEKAETIKSIFLDFNTKMKSPQFTIPSDNEEERHIIYNTLKSHRDEITKIAVSIDPAMTFTDFPFPTLGDLTGIEWLTFIICHSKRHNEQLKNIYKTIALN